MKLRSTVKAKAFGRSGISEALWKDYILLRFPHIYWTIFFFMEHSVLAPMLTQTSLDKSPSAHRLLGDLLFLLLGMDSKGNAGMCKPGLSLRNHLWRLDYFLPSVCLFVFYLEHQMTAIKGTPKRKQYPSERAHNLKLTLCCLQTWGWILASLLHAVWSWTNDLKSPTFNFCISSLIAWWK